MPRESKRASFRQRRTKSCASHSISASQRDDQRRVCLANAPNLGFALSRYFFHVRMKGGAVIRDRTGIEFPSLLAARRDAGEAVRQTIVEKRAAGEPIEMEAIDISGSDGVPIAVIPFDSECAGRQD
jgi:hypothetical protein